MARRKNPRSVAGTVLMVIGGIVVLDMVLKGFREVAEEKKRLGKRETLQYKTQEYRGWTIQLKKPKGWTREYRYYTVQVVSPSLDVVPVEGIYLEGEGIRQGQATIDEILADSPPA